MILFALMLVPLIFAAMIAAAPAAQARRIAIAGTMAAVGVCAYSLVAFDWQNGAAFGFGYSIPWLAELGIDLTVGADSVSMMLMALTVLLGPICVISSKTAITQRHKIYYASLLVLQAAMTGVFASRDLILFYICFEFTLVPMFVLISLFGSTNRKHASVKFFLYTFTGSVIALAGLVYVAWYNAHLPFEALPGALAAALESGRSVQGAGIWTFDIGTLASAAQKMSLSQQSWVLLALLSGFAVKVPLFPLHTWLPLAHTEAPTAGSVILAGVLLKLGTYGIYRFALPFAPAAISEYAPLIAALCIVGILYGGLICWVQTDVKKLVAYSSVAHLGFCVLGLVALNNTGISGSILYMLNHGLSTGALFLLIGMIYERYHTRSMKELGGLAAKMPVWATFMVFFAMASVGLPGLNGFVSEFLCLMGAFQASNAWGSASGMIETAAVAGQSAVDAAHTTGQSVMNSGLWGSAGTLHPGSTPGELGPWYAAIAAVGMIIAAMYLLLMVGKVVWGPLVEPHGHGGHGGHGAHGHTDAARANADTLPTDLNRREIGVLVPLAVLCVVLGVYPKPFLTAIEGPVSETVRIVTAARSAGIKLGTAPYPDSPASHSAPTSPPAEIASVSTDHSTGHSTGNSTGHSTGGGTTR